MILQIDSTLRDRVKVALKERGNVKIKELIIEQKTGSQALLPAIVKIVKDSKINLSDIKSVEVKTGPGSFTGTRVGVAIANALGFALNIPVNGKKAKIVVPIYEKSKFD